MNNLLIFSNNLQNVLTWLGDYRKPTPTVTLAFSRIPVWGEFSETTIYGPGRQPTMADWLGYVRRCADLLYQCMGCGTKCCLYVPEVRWGEQARRIDVKAVSDRIRAIYATADSYRPMSGRHDQNQIGLAGEVEFGAKFGRVPYVRLQRISDRGVDFVLPFGSVQVKTTTTDKLFVEEGKTQADVYVLAMWDSEMQVARLCGWATRDEITAKRPVTTPYGTQSHMLYADRLHHMSELLALAREHEDVPDEGEPMGVPDRVSECIRDAGWEQIRAWNMLGDDRLYVFRKPFPIAYEDQRDGLVDIPTYPASDKILVGYLAPTVIAAYTSPGQWVLELWPDNGDVAISTVAIGRHYMGVQQDNQRRNKMKAEVDEILSDCSQLEDHEDREEWWDQED